MTKQDFISKKQAWAKSFRKYGLILPCAFIYPAIRGFLIDRGLSHSLDAAFCAGFVVVIVGNAIFLLWYFPRSQRKFGLVCPHCGKLLAGQQSSQIVIATGNCVHCGESIFDENTAA
jgi:hypothetical protein